MRKILGAALARFDRIAQARLRGLPFAPMSRPHVQPFLGFHFHPAVEYAAAREYERVRAVIIDDGQLKVAVERRSGNLLPHRGMFGCGINQRIDLNHVVRGRRRSDAVTAKPAVLLPEYRIDLDQFQGGGIRGCCHRNSVPSGWKMDDKPAPPNSSLPGLWYRHAGEQVTGRVGGFRHLRMPELPNGDSRIQAAAARWQVLAAVRAAQRAVDRPSSRSSSVPCAAISPLKTIANRSRTGMAPPSFRAPCGQALRGR